MVTLCVATENVDRADMAEQLKTRGYPSDPIKAWKQSFADQELEESEAKGKGPDYSYLLSMQVQGLIRQEKETLLENRDKKVSLCQERILEGVSYTLCVTIGRGAEGIEGEDSKDVMD